MKHVYIFYRINHYPECHEPSENMDSVFSDKKTLNKKIKEANKAFPGCYGEKDYRIQKIKLNEFYTT